MVIGCDFLKTFWAALARKDETMPDGKSTRRQFLEQSGGLLAGAALVSIISRGAFAGENNTLKIALVGCGSRGTGAALNALSTKGPTKLFAMADAFADRLSGSQTWLSQQLAQQADVPQQRRFIGLDAYQKAIDAVAPGGVVILATPPAFRPMHLEYAVAKRCHVFMEKSFAVDPPGIHRVLKAGEEATKKNLKIAGGLMVRHNPHVQAAIQQIHNGAIGPLSTAWVYRMQEALPFVARRPNESELAHQIRNYNAFTWTNGSCFLDWCIHDIDLCCWVMDAWPVSAQGHGGRQASDTPGQVYDHYTVEYTFADGARMLVQGRHMTNCWMHFIDMVYGGKGSAYLCSVADGAANPRLYKYYTQTPQQQIWPADNRRRNPLEAANCYQTEHDLLFAAIRQDQPYNETERCAKAAMAGILGRIALECGKPVTWDQAMASNVELAPGLEHYTIDSKPPAVPDAQGRYPVVIPGLAEVY
jgi:predicted dehydrogenase